MSEQAYRLTPAAALLTNCGIIGKEAVAFATAIALVKMHHKDTLSRC
jgi:hypothetical protein